MYQPPHEAGFGLRFCGLLRLPFELGSCLGVEFLARLSVVLDDDRPGRQHVSASELRRADPTIQLGLALWPFVPAFKRSVCDGVRTGRDACWAAYEQQAADAAKLALETAWLKLAKNAAYMLLRSSKRLWKLHVLRYGGRLLARVRSKCRRQVSSAEAADVADDLHSEHPRLSRTQVLAVFKQAVHAQQEMQQKISTLARSLLNDGQQKLSFLAAHQKVLELDLPADPMEALGLSEASLPHLLEEYETDEEVMAIAGHLLTCPMGRGDQESAQKLTIDKLVQIHRLMESKLQDVVAEFQQLPSEKQIAITAKQREATAELLVSMAVESELAVRCEDAELAVIIHDEALQQNTDFVKCTEKLAMLMQTLTGAGQFGFGMT